MCLLAFIPENIEFNYEKACIGAKANPDGFGFAIHAGVAIIQDHDMDFEKLWLRWVDFRKHYKGDAIFHFRIATHGTTNLENCHPFNVGDDCKTVVAHNGILPLTMPVYDNRSDTRLFAEYVLPAIGGIEMFDNDQSVKELESWAGGNKLVLLTVEEKAKYNYYIVNENLGFWDAGMWWSNTSYRRNYPYSYVNYGYTSPYLGTSTYDKDKSVDNTYQTNGYSQYDDFIDDEDWETEAYGWRDKHKNRTGGGWNIDDTVDFIEDELYPDSKIMGKILVFTDYSNPDYATITCHNCSLIFYVDALEPSPTHCGDCKVCLCCANSFCNCWDEYEYGQSFVVWDENNEEVKHETKIK